MQYIIFTAFCQTFNKVALILVEYHSFYKQKICKRFMTFLKLTFVSLTIRAIFPQLNTNVTPYTCNHLLQLKIISKILCYRVIVKIFLLCNLLFTATHNQTFANKYKAKHAPSPPPTHWSFIRIRQIFLLIFDKTSKIESDLWILVKRCLCV